MSKIIIEVGSTITKVDYYDGIDIKRLKNITIEFKKNYQINNSLNEEDINKLILEINKLKEEYNDIFVCGTSIFRALKEDEKNSFISLFKEKTALDFNIISQEDESMFTVKGVTRKVKDKVAVMIGGGGSTEITIYDNGIIETSNSNIGGMDVTEKFPDLAGDLATSNLEDVKKYIKDNMNLPQEKADILILAGGAHKYFALESGISYEKNTLYDDEQAPIMMDIETRKKDTLKYYKEISLDEIRKRVDDPKWWWGTRAMAAFVLVVAEQINARYIVPTDVSMVYGIVEKIKKED